MSTGNWTKNNSTQATPSAIDKAKADADLVYWLWSLEQGHMQPVPPRVRTSLSTKVSVDPKVYRRLGAKLVEAAKVAHSPNIRLAIRRIQKFADAVEDQIGQGVYHDECLEDLAAYLRKEADANRGEKCPWRHLSRKLSSRQLKVANALWGLNRRESTEWEVRWDSFIERVWKGKVKESTVRSAISRFKQFLQKEGIQFEATVCDTTVIKCKYRRNS